MNITDVRVVPLKQHFDDRGILYEVLHKSDDFVVADGGFAQSYVVVDRSANIVRAFHKHRELVDWFCIVSGSAKFVLVDDRIDSPTFMQKDVIVLDSRQPSLIVVPAGVFHGWMSLEPNTILLSQANREYNRNAPDEIRIPPNHFEERFGDFWSIEAK